MLFISNYHDIFRASTVDPVAALDALLETARESEPVTEQSEPLEIATQVHIQYCTLYIDIYVLRR